jgi:glycosyltransferase involved in cell wall biosynthesis
LWFGGSGLIHKGLDIVLEIFKKRRDITLHVCGPVEGERVFQKTYYNYLYNTPNIKTYGFVNINSEKFRKLMQACAFTIYPSASEGSSPSVVVVMGNGGLIPILSNASGLDVEEFGFVFEEINHETVEKYIENALELTDGELFKRSLGVLRFADTHHGFENYSRRMEEIIIEILGTKRNAV